MPDAEPTREVKDELQGEVPQGGRAEADRTGSDTGEATSALSKYGVGCLVLGGLCAVAIALLAAIWFRHHHEVAERAYHTRVMQAAAEWTGVLINMNNQNVDDSLRKLQEGTVGQLSEDFEASISPYRDVVQKLQSNTTGRIESVVIETLHHDLDAIPGAPVTPSPGWIPLPSGMVERTDTVLVIASSVNQNRGAPQPPVRWNLRLDVSDVDGKLLISRLESIR